MMRTVVGSACRRTQSRYGILYTAIGSRARRALHALQRAQDIHGPMTGGVAESRATIIIISFCGRHRVGAAAEAGAVTLQESPCLLVTRYWRGK
jgi:hypothetical protein